MKQFMNNRIARREEEAAKLAAETEKGGEK